MASRRVVSTLFALGALTSASPALAQPDTCGGALENVTKLRAERRLLVAKAMAHECATGAACTPEARSACAASESELARSIPTITIAFEGDATRATLSLDGAAVTNGVAYPVDPGQHTVTLATVEGQRREERVLVSENDRARIVMFAPSQAPVATTTTAPSSGSIGPYVTMGSGLLLLLGAATMQTFARVEEADAKSLRRDAWQEESKSISDLYEESASSHHDAAVVNQAFAISLAVVGTITLAVGATWWITSRSARSDAKTGLSTRPFRLTF